MNFKGHIDHPAAYSLESHSQAGQDLFVIAMLQGKRNGTFLEIGANHLQGFSNTFLLEKQFGFSGTSIDIQDVHTEENYQKSYKVWWKGFYEKIKDESWPECPESIDDLPTHIQNEINELHQYEKFKIRFLTWENDRPLTKFVQADARTLEYDFLPETVDYLQIDIDDPIDGLRLLETLTSRCQFSVITFEHDNWKNNDKTRHGRAESRKLLDSLGYVMVANDVTMDPSTGDGYDPKYAPYFFEDWYAHPGLVSRETIDIYTTITTDSTPKDFKDILLRQ